MYKYIGNSSGFPTQSIFGSQQYNSFLLRNEVDKLKKLQSDCNPYENIVRQDDGGVLNGWKLQGVLLLTRHGDRGPMSHVRGINSIDCSSRQTNVLLNKYRTFLTNATNSAQAGHLWNRNGPFHNFPLLSAFPKACLLGQLTYNGI